MKTPLSDTAQPRSALHGADLHSVSPMESTPLRLRRALQRVEDLRRALASSQQEWIAARQQLEAVTKANAQLRKFALRHDQDCACDLQPEGLSRKFTGFCLPVGLDKEATRYVDPLWAKRTRYRKGDGLYCVGGDFKALYVIYAGSCKTVLLTRDGQEQVAGYHLSGEIIGFDGIDTGAHGCQAIALEDMEACPLPFDEVENLARRSGPFGHLLHVWLSREAARTRALTMVLGTMRAEQRLAAFLLDLSHRYRDRGYSSCEFVLRLTRHEIGSYLGLNLETVSRLFSRFQREDLIQAKGRAIRLLNEIALHQLVDGA
ncbi:MAG TPA: helix-turn-helix domain-containing protein [Casimicrobiaceae bacterium]|nr:helix-turn-helix domain-containing protein [Casimicrobiaceae bacterium]